MRYDRARIRAVARDTLRRAQPKPWTVTFIHWFLTLELTALCLIILLAAGWFSLPEGESLPLFTLILPLPVILLTALVLLLLGVGYTAYCFRLSRTGEAGPIDLIQGFLFAPQVLRVELLRLAIVALWALPGLGCVWLLQTLSGLTGLPPVLFLCALLSWTLFGAYLLNRALPYALSLYVTLEEPRRSAWDALQKSKRLMRGRKLDFLLLRLSFLGWDLLTAGAALLPVLPGLLIRATADQLPFLDGAALPEWFLVPFVVAGILAAAPLFLWLCAYRGTAAAGFYQAACAPPFPGVTPARSDLVGGKRLIR